MRSDGELQFRFQTAQEKKRYKKILSKYVIIKPMFVCFCLNLFIIPRLCSAADDTIICTIIIYKMALKNWHLWLAVENGFQKYYSIER